MEYELSKNVALLELREKKALEDLVHVEVYSLLRDALHQISSEALIKTAHALIAQGRSGQVPDSLVLLGARVIHELALLNPRPKGRNRVGEQTRKQFAETATDEVLLGNGRLRDSQILVEDFRTLVHVHLDNSREGKNEA